MQKQNSLECLESADKIREKQKTDRQIARLREHLFGGAGILPAQDSQDGCPTNHISVVLELVSEDKSWQAILDGYPEFTIHEILPTATFFTFAHRGVLQYAPTTALEFLNIKIGDTVR